MDQSKQTEASLNNLKQFRLIEKQIGSIETGRGSQNLRKNTIFEKKKLGTSQSIEIDD